MIIFSWCIRASGDAAGALRAPINRHVCQGREANRGRRDQLFERRRSEAVGEPVLIITIYLIFHHCVWRMDHYGGCHTQQLLKCQLLQPRLISLRPQPSRLDDFSWQWRFTPVGSLNMACTCTKGDFTDFTNEILSFIWGSLLKFVLCILVLKLNKYLSP